MDEGATKRMDIKTDSTESEGKLTTAVEKQAQSAVVVTDDWVKKEPIDTPALFEQYKSRLAQSYQRYFPDDAEFDLFCMLPVTDEERKLLVEKMIKQRTSSLRINVEQ